MNVHLTPRLESIVREKVASGLYNSSSEVVREALRLLNERDYIREKHVQELRREIQKGLDDIARGDIVEWDLETFKEEARKKTTENA